MKNRSLLFTILFLSLPLADIANATEPFMVKNINPGAGSSNPEYLADMNGVLFFPASDGSNGIELWKSNGTEAGTIMIKNINPAGDSYPMLFTNVNGTFFFIADDGSGSELWKTDGTAAGTVMVKDINPAGSSFPQYLINMNGTLFFMAGNTTYGLELWKSDGTEAGTIMVKDIRPGTQGSGPSWLTNVNDTFFFIANDGTHGTELWKSDGTDAGTVLVKDINPAGNSDILYLTDVNGTLFFKANDGANGVELWKSDGTEAGTVMIKDIRPGAASSNPLWVTSVNGTLFFQANDGTNGAELWKSDGSEDGTIMVKNINVIPVPSESSTPQYLTDVDGTLFFQANDYTNGAELWKSDGTDAGTVMIKDIYPGSSSSAPVFLANINGILFFRALDATNGYELWQSDGTSAGTVLVKDICPGSGSSNPQYMTGVNDSLFFSADDCTNGNELWMYRFNDDCQNAWPIYQGQVCCSHNQGAAGDDLTSCAFNDFTDIWYYFQPNIGGEFTINLSSSEFDTTLAVFNACGGDELACNDDYYWQSTDSQVVLGMVKDKLYYIRVAGFNGQYGNYRLSVNATGSCAGWALSDLNQDCIVDLFDFSIMASEWLFEK